MFARVQVDGAEDVLDELGALREWLNAEDEFRGRVDLATAPVQPGEMGAVADALVVAVGSGGAVTALAGSIAVWLRHRRSTLKVTIVHADGSSQTIDATGPAADTLAAKVELDQQ